MEIGNPREVTPLAFFPQDKHHTGGPARPARRAGVTAIENGLPFDEVLQKRSQEIKAERELSLVELAGVRGHVALPMDRILPSSIEAFSIATRYRRRAATPS